MRRSKTILSLSALLALSACPGPNPPEPTKPEFSSISVKCDATAFPINEKTKCSATALDQDGNTLESTSTWTSSNPDVATVDGSGNVEARNYGPVELKVTTMALAKTLEARTSLTVAGTVHRETVLTQGTTWTQKGSPHLVANAIELKDGAGLVVEPGVEVRFAAKAGLRITQGTLKLSGTEQARVRLVAQESTPAKGFWKGVAFPGATKGSELKYTTLSGCGQVEAGDEKAGERACLTVETDTAPVLQQVSIENSGSAGVVFKGTDRGFTADSKALTVKGSAKYALVMDANQADTLPPESVFTDNTPNAIALSGLVTRTQTWRNPGSGASYDFPEGLVVASPAGCILTVSAGTTLRLPPIWPIRIGRLDGPGSLNLDGTEAAPVTLTKSQPETPADLSTNWGGLSFEYPASRISRLSYTVIDYAGLTALEVPALTVDRMDNAPEGTRGVLIDHLTVRNSGDLGAYLAGPLAPGSTHLTITKSRLAPIFARPSSVSSIPQTTSLTGNGRDVVQVASGSLASSYTWRKLDVPYLLDSLYIGDTTATSTPTLTLTAGTTLMVEDRIFVGYDSEQPGRLIARGEEGNRIVFTSASTGTPAPGDWVGLHLRFAEGSVLDKVTVQYGGRDVDPSLFGFGNVNIYRELGNFMTYTNASRSLGCGVTGSTGSRPQDTRVTTNYTNAALANDFSSNAKGAQCTN